MEQTKKLKIIKKIFKFSFFVYLLPIIYGIFAAIFGIEFFGTVYGFDAFFLATLVGFVIGIISCVFPVVLAFQISYLLFTKTKLAAKISVKKYITIVCSIVGVIIFIFLFKIFFYDSLEESIRKSQAKTMIKQAQIEVPYYTGVEECGGIFNLEGYETNTLFISYEKEKIGFLLNTHYPQYVEGKLIQLKDGSDIIEKLENYNVQAVVPLPDNQGMLYSYYAEEGLDNLTYAILIVDSNNTMYYSGYELDCKWDAPIYTNLSYSDYSANK